MPGSAKTPQLSIPRFARKPVAKPIENAKKLQLTIPEFGHKHVETEEKQFMEPLGPSRSQKIMIETDSANSLTTTIENETRQSLDGLQSLNTEQKPKEYPLRGRRSWHVSNSPFQVPVSRFSAYDSPVPSRGDAWTTIASSFTLSRRTSRGIAGGSQKSNSIAVSLRSRWSRLARSLSRGGRGRR